MLWKLYLEWQIRRDKRNARTILASWRCPGPEQLRDEPNRRATRKRRLRRRWRDKWRSWCCTSAASGSRRPSGKATRNGRARRCTTICRGSPVNDFNSFFEKRQKLNVYWVWLFKIVMRCNPQSKFIRTVFN